MTARRPTYRRRSLLTDGDRLWRKVIDAVPEPAVALDGNGQIVHANRLAEEQFGARRRGGHLASMSRAPELLAAVEDALESRQSRAVELQARVPVERRLLATVVPLEHASIGARRAHPHDYVSRSHRAGPAGADAGRLRRQRQP